MAINQFRIDDVEVNIQIFHDTMEKTKFYTRITPIFEAYKFGFQYAIKSVLETVSLGNVLKSYQTEDSGRALAFAQITKMIDDLKSKIDGTLRKEIADGQISYTINTDSYLVYKREKKSYTLTIQVDIVNQNFNFIVNVNDPVSGDRTLDLPIHYANLFRKFSYPEEIQNYIENHMKNRITIEATQYSIGATDEINGTNGTIWITLIPIRMIDNSSEKERKK